MEDDACSYLLILSLKCIIPSPLKILILTKIKKSKKYFQL